RFESVIRRAYGKTGKKVVVLVDEYDKPLVETIDNRELQEKYRRTLKAFYSVLKAQDQYIRFAFLAGVSKFGKVSVFSDLNNLEDISLSLGYASVCGITEKEMHTYFEESIHILAEATKKSYEETCAELKKQYDGYHFHPCGEGKYNPFSLLNTFKSEEIGKHWFSTGTPLMLAKLMQETDYRLDELGEATATADLLGSIETMHSNPIPIIYQTGYLTIQGYDAEFGKYILGFPNKEVEYGFTDYLLRYFVPSVEKSTEFDIDNFVRDVRGGKAEEFMTRLKAMFAGNSYEVAGDKEIYFHNVVQLTFKMMGFYTDVEQTTSGNRIDLVVKTRDYIYIFEFKLDHSAEEALQQIEEKNYAAPYVRDGRKIIKIGVNFSSATRNITDWKIG
ncbi:MAG: ATP-binding protein, partial [Bacteroidales bacterium]|nr:ATP-binding protein [Bacteroidales bacterium]